MINIFLIFIYIITPITLIAQTDTPQQKGTEDPDIYQEDGYWESYSQSPTSGNIGKEVTKDVNIKNIVSVSDDYTYASFGRPDPFVPPLLSSHITQLEIPIVSLLQKYRLDELRVVGIWTLENNARKALMTSSNDEGVIVSIGDHAGNRGGKIIAIEPDVVKVREFTLAPDGTRQFNDRELWLGDEMPEREEKLFIKSTNKPLDDEASYSGQDFLDTTDQEQNRVNKLMGTPTEGNIEENLGEDRGPTTDREPIKENAPEAPFQSDTENIKNPNNADTKKVIESIGKQLPVEGK
ncbi:MAG: pilus assembly protein PilP [Oligoflexales bacterium]